MCLKMIRISIFIFLCLICEVTLETTEELISSGESEITESKTSDVGAMIDEVGEINDFSPDPSENVTLSDDVQIKNMDLNETTTVSMTTNTETTTVTDTSSSSTTMNAETSTTSTTEENTTPTTTPTTTTTTEETTTTTTTTTTPKPTTTRRTTKKPVTTRRTTKKPKTTPSPSTEEPTPAPSEAQCTFINKSFSCDPEIICYGEGEIDCSESLEISPSESPFPVTKVLSSNPSSFSDYEYEEIQTFPPELVGNARPNKPIPFLFNVNTDFSVDVEYTTTPTPPVDTTEGETTVPPKKIKTTTTTTTIPTTTTSTTVTIKTTTMRETTSTEATTKAETTTSDESTTETSTPVTDGDSSEKVTVVTEDVSAALIDDSGEIAEKGKKLRRKKRGGDRLLSSETESSSSSLSLHRPIAAAALESQKQKIVVKTCRITGNLKCSPVPTRGVCTGRSVCKIQTNTGETSEKATADTVENWAIAVIAICAIAAAFTVALLVYLVITSWKKLKVQPQSGVTTLTYVNNSPP